jgi:protease-4
MTEFMGEASVMGLDQMLTAIDKAKKNEEIKGIYIEAGAFVPDSYASMQALRAALADFRASGKWIVAYADTYTQATYYLSSVANKVFLNPQGIIDWHGIAAQPIFVKDLLSKFGVKMQIAKVGSYKSATEMFTGDKMSDEDREQTQAYINGIWEDVTKEVAASRKLTVDQLNAYADSLITFADPNQYVSMKLVDKLLYTDQIKTEVKKLLEIDEDDDEDDGPRPTIKIQDVLDTIRKDEAGVMSIVAKEARRYSSAQEQTWNGTLFTKKYANRQDGDEVIQTGNKETNLSEVKRVLTYLVGKGLVQVRLLNANWMEGEVVA